MATYLQDKRFRRCSICLEPIKPGEWWMGIMPEKTKLEHVHEACARRAVEVWLIKKRRKENEQRAQGPNDGEF